MIKQNCKKQNNFVDTKWFEPVLLFGGKTVDKCDKQRQQHAGSLFEKAGFHENNFVLISILFYFLLLIVVRCVCLSLAKKLFQDENATRSVTRQNGQK